MHHHHGWMDGWSVDKTPLVFIQFLFPANLPHSWEFYRWMCMGWHQNGWMGKWGLFIDGCWVLGAGGGSHLPLASQDDLLRGDPWNHRVAHSGTHLPDSSPNPADSEKVRDATRASLYIHNCCSSTKTLSFHKFICNRVCFTNSYSIVFCFTNSFSSVFP